MGLLKPTGSKKASRFVNPPDNIEDSKGRPGIGSTKMGQKWAKNNMKVEPPSKGDNAWSKVGSKKSPY